MYILQSKTSLQGETAHTLRLCIAVKRKLQLYFWKNRDFLQLSVSLEKLFFNFSYIDVTIHVDYLFLARYNDARHTEMHGLV